MEERRPGLGEPLQKQGWESVLECLGAWRTPESGPRWPFGGGFRAPREGAGRAGRGP